MKCAFARRNISKYSCPTDTACLLCSVQLTLSYADVYTAIRPIQQLLKNMAPLPLDASHVASHASCKCFARASVAFSGRRSVGFLPKGTIAAARLSQAHQLAQVLQFLLVLAKLQNRKIALVQQCPARIYALRYANSPRAACKGKLAVCLINIWLEEAVVHGLVCWVRGCLTNGQVSNVLQTLWIGPTWVPQQRGNLRHKLISQLHVYSFLRVNLGLFVLPHAAVYAINGTDRLAKQVCQSHGRGLATGGKPCDTHQQM